MAYLFHLSIQGNFFLGFSALNWFQRKTISLVLPNRNASEWNSNSVFQFPLIWKSPILHHIMVRARMQYIDDSCWTYAIQKALEGTVMGLVIQIIGSWPEKEEFFSFPEHCIMTLTPMLQGWMRLWQNLSGQSMFNFHTVNLKVEKG